MRILIGIPMTRMYSPFINSFRSFLDKVDNHQIEYLTTWKKFLPDAQNLMANHMMSGNHDALLFIDDDQWGFTPEMLECLINANSLVATIKTYSRHYPYSCTLMTKVNENGLYAGIEDWFGYHEVDMCGFPMTLICRELFEKLDKPYFTAIEALGRKWHTDIPFYQRLEKIGIKPMGCFQHCLNHGKITKDNVLELRYQDSRKRNNKILLDEFFIKNRIIMNQRGV